MYPEPEPFYAFTLLSERHPDLLTVILYGSVARHEERALDAFNTSDVDLLAVFDSDDSLLDVHQGDILSHTLGLAYDRHLDAPREVQVMFASRTLEEWEPTFIANVKRDGIVLYARGTLTRHCFARLVGCAEADPYTLRRGSGAIHRVP